MADPWDGRYHIGFGKLMWGMSFERDAHQKVRPVLNLVWTFSSGEALNLWK